MGETLKLKQEVSALKKELSELINLIKEMPTTFDVREYHKKLDDLKQRVNQGIK